MSINAELKKNRAVLWLLAEWGGRVETRLESHHLTGMETNHSKLTELFQTDPDPLYHMSAFTVHLIFFSMTRRIGLDLPTCQFENDKCGRFNDCSWVEV